MGFETKAIGIALASVCLIGASGCKGEKDFELQDIHPISSQITSFSLQRAKHDSKTNEDLGGYSFSIANNLNVGSIENLTPFPYQSVLDSVKLNIRLSGDSTRTSIELAFGEGTFAPYKSDSIYSIANNVRKLRLKITYKDIDAKGIITPYEYNYQVNLKQYSNNPETISWQEASTLPSPLLSSADLYYIPQPSSSAVLLWEVGSSATASYSLGYSPSNVSVQALMDSGLPSGETIKQVSGYDSYIYALSSGGYLYRLVNNSWIILDANVQAEELLGVFPPRSSSNSPSLALIVGRSSGDRAFARYGDGRLTTSNAAIPSAFPTTTDGSKAYRQAFTQNLDHIGPSITLLGANQESGSITRSAWYSTDGLDWIQRHASNESGVNVASVAFTLISDKYYRLETSSTGLSIYTSTDFGVNWVKNSSVALPSGNMASELISAPIIAWAANDQMLFLYRGGASPSTAALLVGTLLKDKVN